MTGNFGPDEISAIYAGLESHAKSLSIFQHVNTEEPQASPAGGIYCSIVFGELTPYAAASGLNSTTGRLSFHVVIWSQAAKRKYDPTDPKVIAAAAALMGAYSGDFTLNGAVKNVDLMQMTASGGWVEFGGSQCRAIDITLPLVVNDMFAQEAVSD